MPDLRAGYTTTAETEARLRVRVCRAFDAALAMWIELALVLVYTCVLVVKMCGLSEEACATFGRPDAAASLLAGPLHHERRRDQRSVPPVSLASADYVGPERSARGRGRAGPHLRRLD